MKTLHIDVAYFCFVLFFLSRLRDAAKLKKYSNIQNKFGTGWVDPGPFWIENGKLKKTLKKLKSIMIIDFRVINAVKILSQNCTLLVFRHYMYQVLFCPCWRLVSKKVVNSIQIFFLMSEIVLTLQGPLRIVLFSSVLYCILYVL